MVQKSSGQSTQAFGCDPWAYFPTGQATHEPRPTVEKCPPRHSRHTSLAFTGAYLPGAQFVHTPEPITPDVPTAQSVQLIDRPVFLGFVERRPAGHDLHDSCASVSAYWPSGQSRQIMFRRSPWIE
jgi:hypothetical protein